MTQHQQSQLAQNIKEVLIPKIVEMQIAGLYQTPFETKLSSFFKLVIIDGLIFRKYEKGDGENNGLQKLLRHRNVAILNPFEEMEANFDRTPTSIQLDLNDFDDWFVADTATALKSLKLIYYPEKLLIIAQELINHIKQADKYQKSIKEIFDFSKTIALPNTKIVIIEKFINKTQKN